MSDTELIVSDDARFPSEMLEELRLSLLWGVWALDAAEEALQWPVDELTREIQSRSAYGQKIQEIFKMLLIEWDFSMIRAAAIGDLVERIRASLVLAGFDASKNLMYAPIDFDLVPRFVGVDTDQVDRMRPKVWLERRVAADAQAS